MSENGELGLKRISIIYTLGHRIDSISVIDEEEKTINVGDNVCDTVHEIVPSISYGKNLYIGTLLICWEEFSHPLRWRLVRVGLIRALTDG